MIQVPLSIMSYLSVHLRHPCISNFQLFNVCLGYFSISVGYLYVFNLGDTVHNPNTAYHQYMKDTWYFFQNNKDNSHYKRKSSNITLLSMHYRTNCFGDSDREIHTCEIACMDKESASSVNTAYVYSPLESLSFQKTNTP